MENLEPQTPFPEKGDDMGQEVGEILREGEDGEAALYELNQRISTSRPEHLEAAQQGFAALKGGRYAEVIQFATDGQREDDFRNFFGEGRWGRFLELRHMYMNTSMPPQVWQESAAKEELDQMVGEIWTNQTFHQEILSRYAGQKSENTH